MSARPWPPTIVLLDIGLGFLSQFGLLLIVPFQEFFNVLSHWETNRTMRTTEWNTKKRGGNTSSNIKLKSKGWAAWLPMPADSGRLFQIHLYLWKGGRMKLSQWRSNHLKEETTDLRFRLTAEMSKCSEPEHFSPITSSCGNTHLSYSHWCSRNLPPLNCCCCFLCPVLVTWLSSHNK